MPRRALVLSMVLISVVACTGCATPIKRELSDVSPETRIRVAHNSPCCASPVIGTLVSFDADSIRVRVPSHEQTVALSRASITWMESAHSAGRSGRGALIGLGLGTVAGAIVGYSTTCSHCTEDWRGFGLVTGAGAGAIMGTIAGLFVGLGIRRDIWDTVSP